MREENGAEAVSEDTTAKKNLQNQEKQCQKVQ